MRTFPLAALLGLAAVLSGIVAWESGNGGAKPASWSPPPRPAAPPPRREPAAAPADRGRDFAVVLLARPPFNPSRRPVAETASEAAAAPATQALPRLTGVLVSNTRQSAIFAGPPDGKPVVVTEGGWLGRYRVQSIRAGQVTLLGPEGATVLHPTFAPAGTLPAPAASASAPAVPMAGAGNGKLSVLDQLRFGRTASVAIPGLPTPEPPAAGAPVPDAPR